MIEIEKPETMPNLVKLSLNHLNVDMEQPLEIHYVVFYYLHYLVPLLLASRLMEYCMNLLQLKVSWKMFQRLS